MIKLLPIIALVSFTCLAQDSVNQTKLDDARLQQLAPKPDQAFLKPVSIELPLFRIDVVDTNEVVTNFPAPPYTPSQFTLSWYQPGTCLKNDVWKSRDGVHWKKWFTIYNDYIKHDFTVSLTNLSAFDDVCVIKVSASNDK